MASLVRVRYGERVVWRGERSWRVPPATAYRVRYAVPLPSRTVIRARETRRRDVAALLLREAEALEGLLARRMATPEDLQRWVRLRLLRREEAAALAGRDVSATWDELLATYRARAELLRHRTAQTNLARAVRLVEWFRARAPEPSGVSRALVEEWLRQAAGSAAANTVNHTLDVLRALLDPAFPEGNPARAVPKLRAARQARFPRALTPEEDELAVRRAWELRDRLGGVLWPMFAVLRFAGLRLTEARYLPTAHVLPDRLLIQEVVLEAQEVAAGDRFHRWRWQPKAYEARAVTVPRWLAELLLRAAGGRRLVFAEGRAPSKDAVAGALELVLKPIAPDLSPHCLRHTAITALLEEGHPVPWVQAWAGHRDVRTTMRYTHVAVDMRPRSAAALAEALSAEWCGVVQR